MRPRRLRLALCCCAATLLALGGAQDDRKADAPSSLPCPERPSFDGRPPYTVERLVDERTLVVRSERNEELTIRLLGVARPRDDEQRGRLAQFLEQMLVGERVFLSHDGSPATPPPPDPANGSTIEDDTPEAQGAAGSANKANPPADDDSQATPRRYVYRAPDGLLVNLEVIRQGYGPVAARPDFALRRVFRAHERRARDLARGIWAAPVVGAAASAAREESVNDDRRPADRADRERGNTSGAAAPGDMLVYVTPSGSRYHVSGCAHLTKEARAIRLSEAKVKYTACKVCKPPP